MLSRRSVLPLLVGLLALAGSLPARAASAPITVEGTLEGPVRGSAPTTVTLNVPDDGRRALRKFPDGTSVRLSMEGVKAPGGASLRVFVNLPAAGATTPTSDPHYVGAMTSFEDPAADSPGDDFLLDATPVLKKLEKSGRLLPGDTLAVTFVLAPGSAKEDVAIPIQRVVLSIARP
jgi:hypothetical protein